MDPVAESSARILVSGLCSVGKSSFVGALWGDAELLPSAVRDCTQTNTLIRAPQSGDEDRRIRLCYLPREKAMEFVARGLAFYRVGEVLREALGIEAPKLAEMTPEIRIRTGLAALGQLCAKRPEVLVLNEYLTDEVQQLEEFLRFVDSDEYRPGESLPARWDDRRELLMGRRRPDGRTENIGKLWALRHVELSRTPVAAWSDPRVELVDTPWVPPFHDARRTELILEQARTARELVVLSLPQKYEPEAWLLKIWRERPELVKRTRVVFNQVDTIDTTTLFARDGFEAAFNANAEHLGKLGLDPRNLSIACARLPFLELLEATALIEERIAKLRGVLVRIGKMMEGRPASLFKERMQVACDPGDAGVGMLRRELGAVLA